MHKNSNLKVLAIAASAGKIGYVFMSQDKLMDWGLSVKACETVGLAKCKADEWISFYRPDVVITEKTLPYSRKSKRTGKLIEALGIAAKQQKTFHCQVIRQQRHANKYEEAESLAERFPQITGWLPERRQAWEGEANDTIYFEALSLALEYREPPANLPIK